MRDREQRETRNEEEEGEEGGESREEGGGKVAVEDTREQHGEVEGVSVPA